MLENKNGPVPGISEADTRASAEGIFLFFAVVIIFGIFLMYLGVYLIEFEIDDGGIQGIYGGFQGICMGILVICLGILVCVWGWMLYSDDRAQYDFTPEGVWIKYYFEKRKMIPWDEFQEVCVCYTSYTTRGESLAHSVICFVKHGTKYNFYGRWPADNPLKNRKVLSLEYTETLFREVQKNCPFTIPDLRQTRRYRLK